MGEIEGALSEEEWGSALASRAVAFRAIGNALLHAANEIDYGVDRPDPARWHSIAALALYGQPFGFTADDVAFLGEVRTLMTIAGDALDFEHDGRASLSETERKLCLDLVKLNDRGLADRIEALLPPRKP